MAVVGLGTDIAEIERVEKALSRSGDAFAQRILTDSEFEVFQQLKQKDVTLQNVLLQKKRHLRR